MFNENVFAKLIAMGMDMGLVLCLPILLVAIALLIGSVVYVCVLPNSKCTATAAVCVAEFWYLFVLVVANNIIMSL